ncbi:MAG: cytochrome C [Gammaproteobacteria bacterium]|nr:MAG: cytochrome C [Gammaproteobacteria bacterium]
MRKPLATALALLAVIVAGTLLYIYGFLPRQRPAPDFRVVPTPELLARGDYLVNHVLLCNDCHSERDWTLFSGPARPPLGAGRPCMDENTKAVGIDFGMGGFPGRLCIRNITPDVETGIGGWSDGEIVRAIREGVSRNGEALFPIMPWFMYTQLADEDAAAVIAFLRAQPPVKSFRPDRRLDFPLNIVFRFYPRPLDGPVAAPPRSNTVAYGRYLSRIARCEFCHTARERGRLVPVADRLMAGGVPFVMGTRTQHSMNLTPHESGIGPWTREMFIGRFRLHTAPFPVTEEENTEMDWIAFSGMTDADLGAIWDYLRSLPPLPARLLERAD